MTTEHDDIIEMKDVKIKLGGTWVHKGINLSVRKGEVMGIVGGSGSGKTTLMREILCLTRPASGSIRVFGEELTTATSNELLSVQKRWGVLFQQNALFSSLSLMDNVLFPLREHTALDDESMRQIALLKIGMAGLPTDTAIKFPSELSGGMQKRAGLARAIVLDPELLFLDEPTAGLDPETADKFDDLILNLQSTMGLTIVVVTHDLDSLWKVTDRIAFLGEGVVLEVAPIEELTKSKIPEVNAFFNGPRGRQAAEGHTEGSS